MNRSWSSWGKSVIGPAHIKSHIPNQDAYIVKHFVWGDVIVVADGLGSHKNSAIGAKAICEAVVSVAKVYSHISNINIERMLKAIHAKWLHILGEYSPSTASSTCLFVIKIQSKYIIAQLGDGIIIGYSKNNKYNFLLKETKEDSFSNVTNSLKNNFNIKDWRYKVLESEFEAFVLCTDGISDDLMVNKEFDFGRELLNSYKNYSNRRVEAHLSKWLLKWPVPYHSDDKTIACLYRR